MEQAAVESEAQVTPAMNETAASQGHDGNAADGQVASTQETGGHGGPSDEAVAAEDADAAKDCHGQVSEARPKGEDKDSKEAAIVQQAEAVHAQVTSAVTASQDVVDLPEETQQRG